VSSGKQTVTASLIGKKGDPLKVRSNWLREEFEGKVAMQKKARFLFCELSVGSSGVVPTA